MQKWYNDGYFSVDLPMKRTHYDTHWTTVGELVKQSNGENVFLRPLINAIPPGLGRANGSPLQTYPQTDPFNEPYQPAPVRSLRASTLESHLMAGSIPSDSPSSSIGASHSSPDPSMFGTRNKIYGNDVSINGRSTGLGVQEYFTPFTEKRTSHDYPSDFLNGTQLPSFGNFGPEGDLNTNGLGSNDAYADPWKIPLALSVGFSDHKSHPGISSNLGSSANMEHRQDLADTNNSVTTINAFSQGTAYVGPDISYQQSGYIQSDHAPFESFGTSVQDHKDVVTPSSIRDHDETLRSATVPGFWGNVARRPGVREVELLTSASVGVLPNPTAQSSWPRIDDTPISNSQFISNTLNNPDGLSDTAWKIGLRSSSLTTEQIGQQKEEEENAEVGSAPVTSTSSNQIPEQYILDAPMRTLSIKTPNKVVSQPSPVNQHSVINQSSNINHPTPVEPSLTPKAAWAKEEDIKKKASGISVSLREIQEAEAKKLESRKALDREKERSARLTAESKEDTQPFTASWGLPTSQAGYRNNSLPIRESPAASVSPPTTAVWTTPSLKQPAIKKTMKEIQEEEEKHKKQISKETLLAANAKRAYADSTVKVSLLHRSL